MVDAECMEDAFVAGPYGGEIVVVVGKLVELVEGGWLLDRESCAGEEAQCGMRGG